MKDKKKSGFSLNTDREKKIRNKVSLDDVLDSPGKNLNEIIKDKKDCIVLPWENNGVSKKDSHKYLWSMRKEYYLKLDWISENTGHSKSRILSDIVYSSLDKNIKKILSKNE